MIRFQLVGVGLTLSSILGAVLGIAVWVFLPAWPRVLGVLQYNTWIAVLHWAGLAMLVGFASQATALLYGFGPSRPKVRARRLAPGTLLAIALWLVASGGLDFYVDQIGSFGATYGLIGAVIGVVLWLFVSVYAVPQGAELNAEAGAHNARVPWRGEGYGTQAASYDSATASPAVLAGPDVAASWPTSPRPGCGVLLHQFLRAGLLLIQNRGACGGGSEGGANRPCRWVMGQLRARAAFMLLFRNGLLRGH